MTATVIGTAWRGGTLRVSLDTGAFHGLIEALESGRVALLLGRAPAWHGLTALE
jgi:hypothetical protein